VVQLESSHLTIKLYHYQNEALFASVANTL
jgi:hypothetical protein